jgi:large subunit ribosomal protein L10
MPGFDDMETYVKGPVAFVFSEADPFTLSKFLSENKTKAPAKGGQVTPKDIIIPAMNTGVAPGPFISELTALKIPARVKGGSIHVTDDTVVVKAGEIVSNAMAQMLARLGIEPMELQLKLIAAYSDGVLLTQRDFEVDLEALFQDVILAHEYALNLSINTGFPTKNTIPLIIAKANMEAKSLSLNIGFFSPDMLAEFLAKANSEAFALAAQLASKNPEAVPPEVLAQVQTADQTPATTTTSPEADKKKDEPEKKEDKGEEVTGIAGLFG